MASGYRPASYRALYAADPEKTHILTFDYRGYGKSTGHPSEEGLIADAIAVVKWATEVARIPPDRIVIFGQSLGSAVAIALVDTLSTPEQERLNFAGLVITASFSDVAALTATYRIGGVIPVLGPVAKISPLFGFFTNRLSSTWDNGLRLTHFIENAERYYITLIHAEDDGDIPMQHSQRLFAKAIRATQHGTSKVGEDAFENEAWEAMIQERTSNHGEGGSSTAWPTAKGEIRFEVLKYGVHDKIMAYPVTGMAARRAFLSNQGEKKAGEGGI